MLERVSSLDVFRAPTNVMAMLIIEEAPVNDYQSVENGHAAVEGQFGNLCSGQLSICIPKLHNSIVFVNVESICHNTVESSLLDGVMDRPRIVEVDGLGKNHGAGFLSSIRRNDKLANISRIAVAAAHRFLGAESQSLEMVKGQA